MKNPVKAFIELILTHRYWAGIAGIATVAAFLIPLFFRDNGHIPNPKPDCDYFQSNFTATSPENDDFAQVKNQFDIESANIVRACIGKNPKPSINRLVKHYSEQRLLFYSTYRDPISDSRTATNGSSGSAVRYSLSASCRDPLIIDASSFRKSGYGGCYSDEPSRTSISGTVSQTGRGRSECTIRAECIFDQSEIARRVSSERELLH